MLLSKVVKVVDLQNPQQSIYKRAIDAISGRRSYYRLGLVQDGDAQRGRNAVEQTWLYPPREQLNTMAQILTHRSDLFGLEAGRKTDVEVWLGSQDKDGAAIPWLAAEICGSSLGRRVSEDVVKAAVDGIKQAIAQKQDQTLPQQSQRWNR